MMSVHREKISKDKQGFIESVLDRFGRDIRRLQILFLSRPATKGGAGGLRHHWKNVSDIV